MVPVRADERRWKILIPGPHPPSKTVLPLSRRAWVHGSIMDSATTPYGSAQNDRNVEAVIIFLFFKLWHFQCDNQFRYHMFRFTSAILKA